jgi:hemerythrin-like domain-containing protein
MTSPRRRPAPQWIQTAEELVHLLRHHLDEEEQEVFQLAGKVLSEREKTELARAYEAGMDQERAS